MDNYRRAEHTTRPLKEEERAFAEENHNLIYGYIRSHQLDIEEWYDILIIPYLNSVKKYFTYEKLQKYSFSLICYRTLDSARSNYFRNINREKRRPIGGLCSYDSLISDEQNTALNYYIGDKKASIDTQMIFAELFKEFYDKCIYCDDDLWGDTHINGYLKCELDLLLKGHSIKQVNKRTEKVYPHGYNVKDLEGDIREFRKIFKQVFGI